MTIAAKCKLTDKNNRVLLDQQRVEATMELENQDYFHPLRDQAIPQLMERLARKICALLVNIW